MVLLDTHVLLWMLYDESKLTLGAIEALQSNACAISVASFWELAIKSSLGKLKLSKSLKEIADECERMGIDIVDITLEDCACLQNLPWIHRDPFDRIIISHAIAAGMTLVSHDGNIHKYPDVDVLW